MKPSAPLLLVLGLVAAGSVCGCGPRGAVAKEQVLERIDAVLGKIAVKRKEIEHSVASLKEGLTRLREAKIKAQVRADQIRRKVSAVEADLEAFDESLTKLRKHLETDSPARIEGRSYSGAELNQMAKRVLRQRKSHAEHLRRLQKAQERLEKVVGTLADKQAEYEGDLSEIERQIAVIDSNRIALRAMKDAATAMDASDDNLSKSMARLREKVDDLHAEVEAELIGQDARWRDDRSLGSPEEIVSLLQSSEETVEQIESVLEHSPSK